jgi:hypothetical protein
LKANNLLTKNPVGSGGVGPMNNPHLY